MLGRNKRSKTDTRREVDMSVRGGGRLKYVYVALNFFRLDDNCTGPS